MLAAVAGVALSTTPALAQNTAEPIKVGALFSMTGAGSVIGASSITGLNMTVKEVNEGGGILGRKLVVVPADDQSDVTAAVGEAKRLVFREKIDVLFGPSTAGPTLATVPVTTENKIAQFTSAGGSELTPSFAPYHFSTFASVATQAEAAVDVASKAFQPKAVALLTDDTANSKALVVEVKKALARRNLSLVAEETYSVRTPDMTPQLLTLRRAQPDLIYHSGATGEDAGLLLKTLKDIGWTIKVTSYAYGFLAGAALKVAGPDAFDNAYGFTFRAVTYCSSDPVGTTDFSKFSAKLDAFAPDAKGKLQPLNALFTVDAVTAFKAAAEGAHSTEGPKVAAWLEQNSGSIHAIIGKMGANKDDHFLLAPDSFVGVEHPEQRRADGLLKRLGC
jgi:ABC-type branched-subunit amino acid transport system substrate-binding protein